MSNTTVDASVRAHRHAQFELSVALTLFTWPDLTLAVQNNWGGPDSASKREWFAGAIVELFPSPPSPSLAPTQSQSQQATATTTPVPELEDVEERLLQIMEDEFEVVVDDDSSVEVATQILTLWGECAAGNFASVQRLQEEYARRGSRGAETIRAAVVEGDADADGDESVDDEEEWSGLSDEDGDVEMGDAPPQLVDRREKAEPEVDEEGFTKVAGRRRGGVKARHEQT